MNSLSSSIRDFHRESDDYLIQKRDKFDMVEKLFFGILSDSISNRTRNRVFDHKVSTMILESEARVMATTGVGKVKAISKNDQGSAALMNLILDKYIIPNANAQFPLIVKHRMMHRNSKIYGNSFALIDWDVKRNGYVGPDMWLLDIRNVFPQVGAVSLDDSDKILIRTYRPISFFESLKPQQGYKNIDKVITQLKKRSGNKQSRDDDQKTIRESNEYPNSNANKKAGYHEVLMMFERDRWSYAVPEVDYEIIKDQKNPNDDGELPVVNKYGIPLADDFMALGDTERAKTMAYALNSSWNLALASAEMSLFPPVVINQDAVIKSTIKRQAGANWLVRGNINNVAQALQLSPQGIQTHQAVYGLANASLLNLFGTTDTTVSETVDSNFGKTPEALKQQSARMNARDNWDKFYVDLYMGQVNKKFINMMSKKQSSAVQIRMFAPEIRKLADQYPDMAEMYDETTGKLKINKSKTGSVLYDYEFVSGSSFATDQQKQLENLQQTFAWLSNPQVGPYVEQRLEKEGTTINFTKILTGILSKNTENWDEMIITQEKDTPGAEQDQQIINQANEQFMQMVQGMQGEQGMTQIPPQPQDEEAVVQQNMQQFQQMVGQMQQG
jgi:hypothetical protein